MAGQSVVHCIELPTLYLGPGIYSISVVTSYTLAIRQDQDNTVHRFLSVLKANEANCSWIVDHLYHTTHMHTHCTHYKHMLHTLYARTHARTRARTT